MAGSETIPDGGFIVHLLGTGGALTTPRRDTTALAVQAAVGWTLVDCPGGVVHKLARLGAGLADLRRVLLTHDHVDHVYGLPHLLHAMAVWAATRPEGRDRGGDDGAPTLELHAPGTTLRTVAAVVDALRLDRPGYPILDTCEVPHEPGIEVAVDRGLRIVATPAEHDRDAVAYRIEGARGVLGHSGDSGPSEAVARLCRGADLLTHDCAGLHADRDRFPRTHSSAREAGEVAAAAGASRLVLIHLGPEAEAVEPELAKEASEVFGGRVAVGKDGASLAVPEAAVDDRGNDGKPGGGGRPADEGGRDG